jgi:hypothetical protein
MLLQRESIQETEEQERDGDRGKGGKKKRDEGVRGGRRARTIAM